MKIFADNIKRLRKSRKLSRKAFADEVGVAASSVYRWESGRSFPDPDTINDISRIYKIEVHELFIDPDHAPNDLSAKQALNIIRNALKGGRGGSPE